MQRKSGPFQIESERRDLNTKESMEYKLTLRRTNKTVMNEGIEVQNNNYLLDLLPMSILHRPITHQLEERADVIEVVDRLLQCVERGPLLQCLGKLSASILELHEFIVDILDVDILPRNAVVAVDAVDYVVVQLVKSL